jgi:dynein regulatory complex protein 1
MNEEIAKEKMRKVLQADRIIHEQQLGLEWTPPDEDLFKSAEIATEKVERRDKEPVAAALMIAAAVGEENDEEEGGVKDSFGVKLTRKGYSKTMKRMLELLCNEAGFLVEERLQKLLNPLHRDEQSLMKLDSILKALGVETVEDIEGLTSVFVSKHKSEDDAKVSTDGSAVLISPNEVVKAIRKFVEEQRNKSGLDADTSNVQQSRPESQGADEPTEDEPRLSQQSLSTPVAANSYWEKFNTCLNDQNYRTWSAVYVGMEKYNQLLSERWQLTQEITSVTRQNSELRQLLKQYMTARVNDDLHVPPTRILLAQAGLLQK